MGPRFNFGAMGDHACNPTNCKILLLIDSNDQGVRSTVQAPFSNTLTEALDARPTLYVQLS